MTVKYYLSCNLHEISSGDGIVLKSLRICLFRSFGSKHSLNEPSFFSTITSEFTHLVGWSSLLTTPAVSKQSNVSFNFGKIVNGTFRGEWMVGFASIIWLCILHLLCLVLWKCHCIVLIWNWPYFNDQILQC